MKKIWNETLKCREYSYRYWHERWGVVIVRPDVYSKVTAHHDLKTGTLRVNLETIVSTEEDFAWLPLSNTVFETHNGHEKAYRRIVAIADEWQRKVLDSIPPSDTRSDEQVEADAAEIRGKEKQ